MVVNSVLTWSEPSASVGNPLVGFRVRTWFFVQLYELEEEYLSGKLPHYDRSIDINYREWIIYK